MVNGDKPRILMCGIDPAAKSAASIFPGSAEISARV
jgi:hypothetical protein